MRSTIVLWGIAASAVVGTALVVGADLITNGEAAGHVRYHAVFALIVLGVALALGQRAARTGRVSAPALGLLALAISQLVESVGGAGFAADNDTRNDLAVIHDLGLALTPLGLLLAVLGIAIGTWTSTRSRIPAAAAAAVTATTLVAGLLLVKTLVGL